MRGYNRVIIAGNLTRAPEVRATVNKRTYARFGVAMNSKWRNQNGEIQERTDFVNVVVWGAQAENCGKYLKQGSAVLIEGRLQTSTYEAKDGSGKRTSTDIVADSVQFLSGGQQQNNSGGTSWQQNNNYQPRQSVPTQQNNNWGNNYNQPPVFEPPTDDSFGQPIGDGFGEFNPDSDPNFDSSFAGNENNNDIPF